MNTQNSSNSFVDDDLFNNMSFSDMQNSFSINTLDNGIESICQELKNIFLEKLPNVSLYDVENKILKKEMTRLQETFTTILARVDEMIQNNGAKNIFNELNALLEHCIDLLVCLQRAILVIDKKIPLQNVESLPVKTCNILQLVFTHCKESDKIYKNYFEKLTAPLTSLFKKANEVQSIFLNTLNNKIDFNTKDMNDISILAEVAEFLVRIGIIVTSLDIKTSAELWKQLIILIEKYTEILLSRLSVSVAVYFLCDEIISTIETITKLEKENELKSVEKNLKIASFNLKIIIKFCGIFNGNLENCYPKLLELLVSLKKHSLPCLKVFNFNSKLSDLFQTYLIAGTAPLIGSMIEDRQFIHTYFENIPIYFKNDELRLGAIYLSVSLMLKLTTSNSEIRKQWLRNELEFNIISTIFSYLHKCHYELMLDLFNQIQTPPGDQPRKSSLYEFIMLPTAALVLSLNTEQFAFIEKQLLMCLLQTDLWKAFFAIDVWSIAARYGSVDLCNNQLHTLLNIYKKIEKFPDQPEKIFVSQMMANLFSFLNTNNQLDLINKYDVKTYPKIWRILNIFSYTNLQHDFKKDLLDLLNIIDLKINIFMKNNFQLEDFILLCDYLSLIADYPNLNSVSDVSMKNFLNNITQIWQLNDSKDISKATWFQRFTKIRLDVTMAILTQFNSKQLVQILTSLDKLENFDQEYKLMIIQILKQFSHITVEDNYEKNNILKTIELLFQSVLNTQNPIIKQKSLEAFNYFAHNTTHVEILTQVVGNDENLQNDVSNFLRKFIKKDNKISNEYFKNQSLINFEHKCEIFLSCVEPLKKKVKLDVNNDNTNIDIVLQRLCTDVDIISEFYKTNNKLTDSQREKLINIVTKINNVI